MVHQASTDSPVRESLIAVASFLVIFAFSTVDSAVSPLVQVLNEYFQVGEARTLYLVTACTTGTVLGILIGPALTAAYRIDMLLNLAMAGLVAGLALFLVSKDFVFALATRAVFGISSGLFASCMWWVTFYGVSALGREKMITVLMSARPLATALGVPLIGMAAETWDWKTSLWGCFFVLVVSGLWLLVESRGLHNSSLESFSPSKVFRDYLIALREPRASQYYLGFTLNRMCYFGFYVMAGIWFRRHFGTSLVEVSQALLLIGVAEAGINFVVPAIRRRIGHRLAFHGCLWASMVLFPAFVFGSMSYPVTLALIAVFMVLDRIYCMSLVITLPDMFPTAPNRTVLGSLNTLTAWTALSTISFLQGRFLETWGMPAMQSLLWVVLVVGSVMLIRVQNLTFSAEPAK